MHKRKTLLLVVMIVATVSTGTGLAAASVDSTSNGWKSCENAPNAAEGELPIPNTALLNAADGVTNARTAACGDLA